MLIKRTTLDLIAAGKVSLAFRRWRKPTVKKGGRLRTKVGELAIDEVKVIDEEEITDKDAKKAGFASKAELLEELQGFEKGGEAPKSGWMAQRAADSRLRFRDVAQELAERKLYRIRLHLAGPDQRQVLRDKADVSDKELAAIRQKLDRLDAASNQGPWTRRVLQVIAEQPQVLALDLAKSLKLERAWFKAQVRKLKELGLTESLRPGYRLSPRGRAVLAKLK
jgi:hypothetical protein